MYCLLRRCPTLVVRSRPDKIFCPLAFSQVQAWSCKTESGMLIAGKRQQNRVPPEPVEGPMKMRPNASEIEGLISSISKGRFRKGPKEPLLIFDL